MYYFNMTLVIIIIMEVFNFSVMGYYTMSPWFTGTINNFVIEDCISIVKS